MKKKDVNQHLKTLAGSLLKEESYRYNKSRSGMELMEGDFAFYINWRVLDYHPEYEVFFEIDIRHKEVEAIANPCSYLAPEYYKFSTTVMILPSYFTGERIRLKIKEETDFLPVKEYLSKLYHRHLKSFFKSVNTLETLSQFISNSLKEQRSVPILPNLYIRQMILLKLTGSRRFEEYVKQTRELLKNYPKRDIENLERTYDFLVNNKQPPAKTSTSKQTSQKDTPVEEKPEEGVIKKIIVTGFDEEFPPVLKVLENGTTSLIFEIFPPDDKLTEHQLDNFEHLLSEVAGVKVTQDDRELFIINSNDLQVVDKVKKYLESL